MERISVKVIELSWDYTSSSSLFICSPEYLNDFEYFHKNNKYFMAHEMEITTAAAFAPLAHTVADNNFPTEFDPKCHKSVTFSKNSTANALSNRRIIIIYTRVANKFITFIIFFIKYVSECVCVRASVRALFYTNGPVSSPESVCIYWIYIWTGHEQ